MPDGQLIGILIAAMLAGVVLFRLYAVLGRRTGHEPQNGSKPDNRALAAAPPRDIRAQADTPPPEAATARGLLDIEMADKGFDRDHFLKGARAAYEIIQKAYADADRLALRPLLSNEVYAAFDGEIARRPGAPDRLAAVSDARIVAAELAGRVADITVAFRAGFTAPGGAVRQVVDRWSFARTLGAVDPNWVLVATAGEQP